MGTVIKNDVLLKKADLSKVLCSTPYWKFQIKKTGAIYHCCSTWMPTSIGNIKEISILNALNSEISQNIRASMEEGEFSYCSKTLCPSLSVFLNSGKAMNPIFYRDDPNHLEDLTLLGRGHMSIMMNYDESCNLRCPSCRSEQLLYSEENMPPSLRAVHEATVKNIFDIRRAGYSLSLGITGSGDAFASPLYYGFLRELKADPGIFLNLKTNGQLMRLDRFTEDMFQMIEYISVSVDAASKETYSVVRRGGVFDLVMKNLRDLDVAIQAGKFRKFVKLYVNFVVQKENYREMAQFAETMLELKSVGELWYNQIADWGHLSAQEFFRKAIWRQDHPEHQDFLQQMRNPVLKQDSRINLGNLSHFL